MKKIKEIDCINYKDGSPIIAWDNLDENEQPSVMRIKILLSDKLNEIIKTLNLLSKALKK